MKILVAVKRVIDYNVQIQIKPDESGVVTDGVKMSMNPFDEIAMEEAVRLKEKGLAKEVVAVSLGSHTSEEVLRHALAMGADKALLLKDDACAVQEPRLIAKCIAHAVALENPDLVMLGKQAIDNDHNQTGQMLAKLLGWPQGTFVSVLKVDKHNLEVTREIDGGLETLKLKLPSVVTTDLRLNKPRFLALPNIIRAKQKPLEVLDLTALGLELLPQVSLKKVEAPAVRQQGELFTDFEEFYTKLQQSGVLE